MVNWTKSRQSALTRKGLRLLHLDTRISVVRRDGRATKAPGCRREIKIAGWKRRTCGIETLLFGSVGNGNLFNRKSQPRGGVIFARRCFFSVFFFFFLSLRFLDIRRNESELYRLARHVAGKNTLRVVALYRVMIFVFQIRPYTRFHVRFNEFGNRLPNS